VLEKEDSIRTVLISPSVYIRDGACKGRIIYAANKAATGCKTFAFDQWVISKSGFVESLGLIYKMIVKEGPIPVNVIYRLRRLKSFFFYTI
jgi:hypothetical protein